MMGRRASLRPCPICLFRFYFKVFLTFGVKRLLGLVKSIISLRLRSNSDGNVRLLCLETVISNRANICRPDSSPSSKYHP